MMLMLIDGQSEIGPQADVIRPYLEINLQPPTVNIFRILSAYLLRTLV